jgi:hypothetical protein
VIARSKRGDVLAAADDFRRRTLSHAPRALDRLIYLASMRDYNTGLYHHEGLAARYSQEAACEAVADCHREAFRELLSSPLEDLVEELETYMISSQTEPADFIRAWRSLEPYRVAVPAGTDSLSVEFLFSNLKVALAILEHQHAPHPKPIPAA